jgi:SAM-dependent methyltransferase
MRLVVGPSCAGKSTYITRLRTEAAARGEVLEVHYLFELVGEGARIPDGPLDVVHLNLLWRFRRNRRRPAVEIEELIGRLVAAADEVVVVAAPRSVLKSRAAGRSQGEPDDERYVQRGFDAGSWTQALDTPHLAQVYEQLALHLDSAGTPHRYLCTHDEGHDGFAQISRWELPRLAGEDAEERCRAGHALTLPDLGRTYQADYREGVSRSKRSATLGRILQMPLAGKAVLDIGCAEGAASLSAARMGARVTGLEPRASRLTKARAIADATGSSVVLHETTLDDFDAPARAFDVVLALNVVHHVLDPFAFLDRAAQLTSSHLVLEYPGVSDPKFRRTVDEPSPADSLPFVGVSTAAEGQTFVFSPTSLERYLVGHLGVFRHHEVVASPIPDRWISVFSGKKRGTVPRSAVAARLRLKRRNTALRQRVKRESSRVSELERQNAALRDRLQQVEESRSWRMTAPLRTLADRVR